MITMKPFFRLTLLLALTGTLQQCSYSQNKPGIKNSTTMDTTQKKNPVYSTSDTGKVTMSDEEWKKILPAMCFIWQKHQPWSKFEDLKEAAPTIVPPVVTPV
jgi:peptide-methionine (R)-S-oxide reductase